MDAILRCNDLTCRTHLNESAVVTTCSHIFCLPCADRLELSAPPDGQRKCPACETCLVNLDDAVMAALNPTEDYKTSILSGLNPTVIMECAGRGLSFWAYQTAQEITYQECLARNLKARYQELSTHLDRVTREANEENTRLHSKVETMQGEHAVLLERTQNMEATHRQKERAWKEQYVLYERLKRQHMEAGMQLAAEHTMHSIVQQGLGPEGQSQRRSQHPGYVSRRSASNTSGNSHERRRVTLGPNARNGGNDYMPQGARAGLLSSQSTTNHTTNTNRQRLPQPAFGTYNTTLNRGAGMAAAGLHNGLPVGSASTRGQQAQGNYGHDGGIALPANMRSNQPSGFLSGSRAGVGALGGAGAAGYNGMSMH